MQDFKYKNYIKENFILNLYLLQVFQIYDRKRKK